MRRSRKKHRRLRTHPATTVDAPKTGDHTPIAALMISCGLGLAGAIAAAVWMKVRKKKRD